MAARRGDARAARALTVKVVDPDAVEWEVGRRWLERPGWSRRRDVDGDGWWYADGGDVDGLLGIALVVAFVLLLVFGLPLLVAVLGLVVALGGLVARVLLGRPWLVEARNERGELAWRVRGVRRSRRAVEEVAAALARGDRGFSPPGSTRVVADALERPSERRSGTVRVLGRRRR